MSSMPKFQPGKLHLLQWPPEIAEKNSIRGGEWLNRAQLVIASSDLPEMATHGIPDATPVVHLPSGKSASADMALELVRKTVLDGHSVVWLQGAEAASISEESGSCDIHRWCSERGIECETLSKGSCSPGPLADSWILVARSRHQVYSTVQQLSDLGATVVSRPAIVIKPIDDTDELDAAIDRLESYDWLVFSSVNGVRFFFERLWARQEDLRRLGSVKLAAIGSSTAEALGEYRLRADLVPDEYRAEALADALASIAAGKRVLLARASRGREVLAERLRAAGAHVEQVVVYESIDACPSEAQQKPVMRLLDQGRIDWAMITSTAIARSLVRLYGRRLKKTRLASISPVTTAALAELDYKPTVEAKQYTIEGLIEATVAVHGSIDELS